MCTTMHESSATWVHLCLNSHMDGLREIVTGFTVVGDSSAPFQKYKSYQVCIGGIATSVSSQSCFISTVSTPLDRFVNTRGGLGHNIPCDLYNENVNKMLKHIIASMGSNLTETFLQRAARSVSTRHAICSQFDKGSNFAIGTHAHSTRSDMEDVAKVTSAVIKLKLLEVLPGRAQSAYRKIKLNPLHSWDKKKTIEWIEKDFMKFDGAIRGENRYHILHLFAQISQHLLGSLPGLGHKESTWSKIHLCLHTVMFSKYLLTAASSWS